MGIRMEEDSNDEGISAFSEDILKIDIDGPDVRYLVPRPPFPRVVSPTDAGTQQAHLTLIDVPGIFRIPTPGT